MVRTVQEDEPSGFEMLAFSLPAVGEGYLQAPDGSVCHIEWHTPDAIHFEEVPTVEGVEVRTPLGDAESEYFRDHFADDWKRSEEWQAVAPDWLDYDLPELRAQWERWKATKRH